jgi:transaldolase
VRRCSPPSHGLGGRPNLSIEILGTGEGLAAIEDTIFAGVPVNVILLFSPAQYLGFGHELQVKGADAFVVSWSSLLDRIGAKVGEVPAGT